MLFKLTKSHVGAFFRRVLNGDKSMPLGVKLKVAGSRGDTRFEWNGIDIKGDKIIAVGWFHNQVVARDTVIVK